MGWNRQAPFIKEHPLPPSLSIWLLSAALAFITSALLFFLHLSENLKIINQLNIWLFSLIPMVLWILFFSIQGYLYGREIEHYRFLKDEAEFAQKKWIAWADRYLAVMASSIMLPGQITALLLKENSQTLTQQQGLVRRMTYLPENKTQSASAIMGLLNAVREALLVLPKELPVMVTLLTDYQDDKKSDLAQIFTESWQTCITEFPLPLSLIITSQLSFCALEERLKNPETSIQLVAVLQLNGGKNYSDALSITLFTSDDVAQKYALPHDIRILRPMPLDLNTLDEEIRLLLTTQIQAIRASTILADRQEWSESSAEIISVGNALGTTWSAGEAITVETYCGIPGPFSPWITSALAADIVRIDQQPLLALSSSGAENFVYTITSGNGDEYVE